MFHVCRLRNGYPSLSRAWRAWKNRRSQTDLEDENGRTRSQAASPLLRSLLVEEKIPNSEQRVVSPLWVRFSATDGSPFSLKLPFMKVPESVNIHPASLLVALNSSARRVRNVSVLLLGCLPRTSNAEERQMFDLPFWFAGLKYGLGAHGMTLKDVRVPDNVEEEAAEIRQSHVPFRNFLVVSEDLKFHDVQDVPHLVLCPHRSPESIKNFFLFWADDQVNSLSQLLLLVKAQIPFLHYSWFIDTYDNATLLPFNSYILDCKDLLRTATLALAETKTCLTTRSNKTVHRLSASAFAELQGDSDPVARAERHCLSHNRHHKRSAANELLRPEEEEEEFSRLSATYRPKSQRQSSSQAHDRQADLIPQEWWLEDKSLFIGEENCFSQALRTSLQTEGEVMNAGGVTKRTSSAKSLGPLAQSSSTDTAFGGEEENRFKATASATTSRQATRRSSIYQERTPSASTQVQEEEEFETRIIPDWEFLGPVPKLRLGLTASRLAHFPSLPQACVTHLPIGDTVLLISLPGLAVNFLLGGLQDVLLNPLAERSGGKKDQEVLLTALEKRLMATTLRVRGQIGSSGLSVSDNSGGTVVLSRLQHILLRPAPQKRPLEWRVLSMSAGELGQGPVTVLTSVEESYWLGQCTDAVSRMCQERLKAKTNPDMSCQNIGSEEVSKLIDSIVEVTVETLVGFVKTAGSRKSLDSPSSDERQIEHVLRLARIAHQMVLNGQNGVGWRTCLKSVPKVKRLVTTAQLKVHANDLNATALTIFHGSHTVDEYVYGPVQQLSLEFAKWFCESVLCKALKSMKDLPPDTTWKVRNFIKALEAAVHPPKLEPLHEDDNFGSLHFFPAASSQPCIIPMECELLTRDAPSSPTPITQDDALIQDFNVIYNESAHYHDLTIEALRTHASKMSSQENCS